MITSRERFILLVSSDVSVFCPTCWSFYLWLLSLWQKNKFNLFSNHFDIFFQFLVVFNGRVLTLGQNPTVIPNGAVCIDRKTGLIVKVDETAKVLDEFKDAELIDVDERLVFLTFFFFYSNSFSRLFPVSSVRTPTSTVCSRVGKPLLALQLKHLLKFSRSCGGSLIKLWLLKMSI